MNRTAAWIFSLALLLPASIAEGAEAQGVPVADIVAAMQDYGVRAKLGEDEQGDPQIESALAGANFNLRFYDCAKDRCSSIQFLSGFDLEEGMSLEDVNDWNRTMRYGSVYLDDEGDPYLQMDVDVTRGIDKEQFAEWMAVWEEVLGRFMERIDSPDDTEEPESEPMRSS
ncbi:YbjN domain-containing protein [Arenimonas sp.]|uniref:YbjN domain-containing protein n=1 Tax=Arenimonas sp. TaxID=1872635 RepID=UPI0039E47739